MYVKVTEKSLSLSCPTLCDPWTVVGQAPLSMGFSRQEYWSGLPFPSPPYAKTSKVYMLQLSLFSHVQLCVTPQTAAHQAPPSQRFSRQEHWSGLPFLLQCMKVESEKWKRSRSLSRVQLLATPWNAAYQAPPSKGFSRQEYWSGLPLPSLDIYAYMCVCVCVCNHTIFNFKHPPGFLEHIPADKGRLLHMLSHPRLNCPS